MFMATSPTPVPRPAISMIRASVGTEFANGTSAQAARQITVAGRLTAIEEYRSASKPVNGMETIEPIPTQTSANAREVGVAPTWSRISGILESEEPITRPFPMNITATASGDPYDRNLSVHLDIQVSFQASQRLSLRAIVMASLRKISEGWTMALGAAA